MAQPNIPESNQWVTMQNLLGSRTWGRYITINYQDKTVYLLLHTKAHTVLLFWFWLNWSECESVWKKALRFWDSTTGTESVCKCCKCPLVNVSVWMYLVGWFFILFLFKYHLILFIFFVMILMKATSWNVLVKQWSLSARQVLPNSEDKEDHLHFILILVSP